MAENNNNITEFDLDTLKHNLNDLLTEKNLTQTEFGAAAGIEQSRVSTILNYQNSQCVTVAQLAKIALAFNVSTDDLLGITHNKKDDDVTLSDVFQRFFEIDNMIDLNMNIRKERYANHAEGMLTILEMTFHYGILADKIDEWVQLKSVQMSGSIKKEMLHLWENNLLQDGTKYKKEDFNVDPLDNLPFY